MRTELIVGAGLVVSAGVCGAGFFALYNSQEEVFTGVMPTLNPMLSTQALDGITIINGGTETPILITPTVATEVNNNVIIAQVSQTELGLFYSKLEKVPEGFFKLFISMPDNLAGVKLDAIEVVCIDPTTTFAIKINPDIVDGENGQDPLRIASQNPTDNGLITSFAAATITGQTLGKDRFTNGNLVHVADLLPNQIGKTNPSCHVNIIVNGDTAQMYQVSGFTIPSSVLSQNIEH